MFLRMFVSPAHEGADCRGGGVEDGDAMPLDDLPETIRFRPVRRPFVHQRCGPVQQRTVDHVGMPGHPADISGAPVDVLIFHVEHGLRGVPGPHHVAGQRVEYSFGFAGGAGSIKDVQGVFALQLCGRVAGGCPFHQIVPPVVAVPLHLYVVSGAAQHDHMFERRNLFCRLVRRLLQLHHRSAPVGAVLRYQELCAGVVHPLPQRVCTEPAEDDIVYGADPRAGQHRHRRLRHHSHVDADGVALFDPERFQNVGECAHLAVKLLVGKGAHVPRLSFPDDCGLGPSPGVQVAVQAVIAHVGPAADEPLCVRGLPLQNLLPGGEPVESGGKVSPELLGVLPGQLAQPPVLPHRSDAGRRGEFVRRSKDAVFAQDRRDRIVCVLLFLSLPGCSGHERYLQERLVKGRPGGAPCVVAFVRAPGMFAVRRFSVIGSTEKKIRKQAHSEL